jgi:hypothetical protein
VFKAYGELYAAPNGFDLPALIPQVYLHYDPYTQKERGVPGPLVRQHYAGDDGRAAPERYAEMMKEDRALRLAGYEVYRFGTKELMNGQTSRELARGFFQSLLEKHLTGMDKGQPRLRPADPPHDSK